MTIQSFISLHQRSWQRLDDYLYDVQNLGPSSIPAVHLGDYIRLYRKSVSDLAYARSYAPDHPVVGELESLVARAQATFYRPPTGGQWRALRHFLLSEFPQTVVESWRPIVTAMLVFAVAAMAGFIVVLSDLDFAYAIVPSNMMEALSYHDLWTGHESQLSPLTSSFLATHNGNVSLQAFALGITLGLGTLAILLFNGFYFGAVMGAAAHFEMLDDLTAFVVPHGVLEIPEIWISAGAGLLLGKALLFPRPYSRHDALRREGGRALKLLLGGLPLLLMAALIEANFSPTRVDWSARYLVAGLGAGLLLLYTMGTPLYNRLRSLMSR